MTQASNLAIGGSNFNATGKLSLTTGVTGTLPAANGGTGLTSFPAPGTNGNLLTSNGTAWTSASPPVSMVYPGAGIANSTGTAWGTSYTTTGTGTVVALATSPTFVTPILGTPTSGTLTNCTFPTLNQNTTGTAAGLSATLAVASGGTGVTTSTGSGSNVLSTSPTLTTPILGTPTSGNLANCTFPTLNQNTTGSSGSCTGNAATATTATTATNQSGGTVAATTGSFSSTLSVGAKIQRTASGVGYLDGKYDSGGETVSTSGAIYSIGGAYIPGTTTLGNMYGIGYGYSGNAGITATGAPANLWGMYVASGGVSRIFLDADNGRGFFNGAVSASSFSGAGTGLTGTASSLSIGGSSASCTGNAATATNVAGSGITGSRNIPKAAMPAGTVLQVVSSTKTDTASSTSATFVDVSGLSVTITPTSSSSTFLINFNIAFGGVVDAYPAVRLVRNSTNIAIGTSATGVQLNVTSAGAITASASTYDYKNASMTHLDSPATASAITYKIQFASPYYSLTGYINQQATNTQLTANQDPVSSITVMEIAA